MAKEKRTPHKVVMTEGKREIIRGLLSEYDIQSAQDIQEALKDLLGGTISVTRLRQKDFFKSFCYCTITKIFSGKG
ncbi:MAG: hypothetical protein J6J11_07570 [Treponema sp.]|nr:hypothetical protein [Treponema sp.]